MLSLQNYCPINAIEAIRTTCKDMTVKHKALLVFFFLLWLSLSYVMLSRTGVTLYNIIWALVAAGIIFIPLWKKWNPKN